MGILDDAGKGLGMLKDVAGKTPAGRLLSAGGKAAGKLLPGRARFVPIEAEASHRPAAKATERAHD